MNCPHCQAQLPENFATESCPSCWCNLPVPSESKSPNAMPGDKSVYWLIFWVVFFASPILCLAMASGGNSIGILFIPVGGAIIAGFSLAGVYSETPAKYVVTGMLFTLGVLAIYVGIIFVGCLVVLGHGGGI